jgi:hypothetical protein
VIKRSSPSTLITPLAGKNFVGSDEALDLLQRDEFLGKTEALPDAVQQADGEVLEALSGLVNYLETIMLSKELITMRNFSRCAT